MTTHRIFSMGIDEAYSRNFSNFSPSDTPQSRVLKQKPVILAVDDDDDSLMLLSYFFEQLGWTFIHHDDGQTALPLIQRCQPDVIILDILLPGLSGIELLFRLRHNLQMNHVPVIAVTALAQAEDRESIMAAGFSDYISKPYMLDEMEAMISRHLRKSLSTLSEAGFPDTSCPSADSMESRTLIENGCNADASNI